MKNMSKGLRVIGGELRGKKLRSVHGMTTRPTTNRVRESIFNILSTRVCKAVVLDLFAGTGILGIEALSRGAQFALFIDHDKAPVDVIKKNLHACRLDGRGTVFRHDIQKGLPWLTSYPSPFGLVFMDPPYHQGLVKTALGHLHHSGSLATAAQVVVEHDPREPVPDTLPPFIRTDQRKYGKTLVSFLTYNI